MRLQHAILQYKHITNSLKAQLLPQDKFDVPYGEELEEMKKANSKLQEELADQKKLISEVESGKFCVVPWSLLPFLIQYVMISI